MQDSLRCGARTRSGEPCRSPAVTGKQRCRMHGGAEGSGAPPGNRNALKHGVYSREAIAERRAFSEMLREMNKTLRDFEE
jgi:glucans biosynthesis protein